MKNILIIDDDQHVGDMLEEALRREGYSVLRAYSGTEALMVLKLARPDLVLLDLMLPGLRGEEVLAQIRDVPVIVVSAKVDLDDKVDALEGGAVDYVTKPFELRELMARIAAHLRARPVRPEVLRHMDLELDEDTRAVRARGREVRLTRTEYAILRLLMRNPGQVVTKSRILDSVGEDTPDCTESSLKTHMSHLRGKLGGDYIEAVWGIGFRLRDDIN